MFSLHSDDSCPSDEVVGGFFFDSEAIRTESRPRCSAQVSRLSEIGKLETEGFTALLGDPQKYKEVGNSECGVLEPSVKAEKDRLLEAGFRQWTKERFMQWRRLSAQHGRHAHDKITAGLQGVAPGIEISEVKAFHAAFFDQKKAEKWRDQAEYSRALRQIERGEKATIDSKKNDSAFEELVSSAVEEGNALDALPIDGGGPATQIRDDERPYTRSEDRFLLTASYLLKDTDGHALSAAMRSTDRFLFDRRILGASHNDLASRCVALKSKCEGVRASRERQAQKALEKKRAVRPAHIVEAELRALEPKLKQAKREESQATDEWKKLERDIRGLSSRSAPRQSLSKPEPRQLRLKPFVYYVRERGASLVAGAELPERDDMEPAVEETLAMLETNWGGEGDAAKGELLSRVPSS